MCKRILVFLPIICFIFCVGCSLIKTSGEPAWINGPSAFEKGGCVYGVGLSPRTEDLTWASRAAKISARGQILNFLEANLGLGRADKEAVWSLMEMEKIWRDGGREVTYIMFRYQIPKE